MSRPIVLALLVAFMTSRAFCHSLDQYLEIAQVSIARDTIAVDLRLIPGSQVADKVLGLIDENRDGKLSEDEQRHYISRVISDLSLKVDGIEMPLRLVESSFPGRAEVLEGAGIIHLLLRTDKGLSSSGRHAVTFSNGHQPGLGFSQINALVPVDPGLIVESQDRDPKQRTLRLVVSDGRPSLRTWIEGGLILATAALLIIIYIKRAYVED